MILDDIKVLVCQTCCITKLPVVMLPYVKDSTNENENH